MEHDGSEVRQWEIHELSGALAALSTLQEKLELRLNEARDECTREALDNIIALVAAHASEYRHRHQNLQAGITQ
jgi:hypothetical protein